MQVTCWVAEKLKRICPLTVASDAPKIEEGAQRRHESDSNALLPRIQVPDSEHQQHGLSMDKLAQELVCT